MNSGSLINPSRPPVFCPGCSHETVVKALDRALVNLGLQGDRVCIVSDIGCSGLFDTFFNTHAVHGLHGRALTYATGIKMCRPELKVIVTLGDGGVGIGGAHFLAACRRNLDLTLIIMNNFNFGMTGGQHSSTTPQDASVTTSFLNRIEKPLPVAEVAAAAGAPFVYVCSAQDGNLTGILEEAVKFDGFSVVEIREICPGRYSRRNRLTPKMLEESVKLTPFRGLVEHNLRTEYGKAYREHLGKLEPVSLPEGIEIRFEPLERRRYEVLILGAAGQHVVTAGEVLALAAMSAGLRVAQKNEYDITVLRGPSIAEVILSGDEIHYTGIKSPDVVLAVAQEGVERRRAIFEKLSEKSLIICDSGLNLPACPAEIKEVSFRDLGIKKNQRAFGALALMAIMKRGITVDMLRFAIERRYESQKIRQEMREMLKKLSEGITGNGNR
ncbi:thiamine pyrophosphate-dependent enzyme [Thermodesulforhabdus norvegica]|uniref:Pyruvate ferredoxin/flavodoxin oxidoreductase n=1 Tax=Thermodesulforhabdus norvegica TaxID=39841 RepID=A0A1I4R279_9BACT|nr:thiamine pyrophosphate-dependent enzyme [Thermodesulforhabdus norvegica]SFM46434.1 Pyruvate ferredoxin/flavodoxin oxidoreductase [Thermodesulforhabdus norvegica]